MTAPSTQDPASVLDIIRYNYGEDVQEGYNYLRTHFPVLQGNDSVWNVFRYDDVQRVLKTYQQFSSQLLNRPLGLVMSDPPEDHTKLRLQLAPFFTKDALQFLEERTAAHVDALLEAALSGGRETFDMIRQLTAPLAQVVLAEFIGMPTKDGPLLQEWSERFLMSEFSGRANRDDIVSYFQQLIQARRNEPTPDLISRLLPVLSEQEIVMFALQLVVAGCIPASDGVGNAILCFNEHPDAWTTLRADTSLLPLAIEEILRIRSPLPFFRRQAVQDVDVSGVTIPKGAVVRAWIGAANRDSEEFTHSELFDMQHNPNRHIAFGFGSHACLGAPFARLQMRVVLAALLDRFSSIRRADAAPLERSAPLAYGVRQLLVSYKY